MDTISKLTKNISKFDAVTKNISKFTKDLIDDKSFVELDVFTSGKNFIDGTEALGEGVRTGYATINDMPVYLFAQNFEVFKGSMSIAQALKIEKCIKMAIKTGTPFISIIDSAGARIGEGVGVLEGYSRIIKAAQMMKGVIPHIVIIKGACVGLMSAYADTADFIFMDKKNGYKCLGTPSVIASNAKVDNNEVGLFGAEPMRNNCVSIAFDKVKDAKAQIYEILDILSASTESEDNANRISTVLNKSASLENVLKAVLDNGKYIALGNNEKIVTALARVNGVSVGIIATNKAVNDGRLGYNSLRQIKRFVNVLDNFSIPLITLVDSQGMNSCLKCEQIGLSSVASDAFYAIAQSDMPKIAVIYGDAIGMAYSLLASKGIGFDYVIAFANARIAPLTADTAVNFMYLDEIKNAKDAVKEREALTKTYGEREGNPFISAKDGYIDNIIEPANVRPYICSILNMLGN